MPAGPANTTEEYPDISHPDIQALLLTEELPEGQRGDSILAAMNAAGKSGWTNHQILKLGSELCDRWDKHPSTNLYEHWERLLQMLKNVRRHHPGPTRDHEGRPISAGRA